MQLENRKPAILFLLLSVMGIVTNIFALTSNIDPAAKFSIIGVTIVFIFLWSLFFFGDKFIRYTLTIPSFIILFCVTSIPAIFLLYLSVFDVSLLNFKGDWSFVGLTNYIYFFTKDKLFYAAVIRTVEYMVIVLMLQIVIGMCLALLLQREFRGRSLVSTILVIPVMTCPIVIAMLWKYMYSSYNGFINLVLNKLGFAEVPWLTNQPLPFIDSIPVIGDFLIKHLNANIGFVSAIIVNIWQWTPFVYLMFLAGLSSLPREPFEAAKVDGASSWRTFWHLTFPMLRPVIGVVILIRIIDLMKVYDQIWALFGDSVAMRTLNIHIFSVGLTGQDYSKGAALSIIVLLFIIAVSFVFSGIGKWVSTRGHSQ
ncbi:sugar ABC transporter permease [Paenibacillus marchantiophytorum]|uniref:Sugar ABC transporter permease n=1 Tax=Paenibacillus marchantiophytorum TaxID=1619310 RepID=A0ABQ2BQ11_9BACL|nr:sugar ABC transporter permease [Paenibacillus marchantiophytorum]GGI44887.1 sugar ABC transporter permease [Paenibacillus marchantiophytorum]